MHVPKDLIKWHPAILNTDDKQEIIDRLQIKNQELEVELRALEEKHDALIDLIGGHLDEMVQQNKIVETLANELPGLVKNFIRPIFLDVITPVVNQHNQLLEVAIKHKRAAINFKTKLKKHRKGPDVKKQRTFDKWEPLRIAYDALTVGGTEQ